MSSVKAASSVPISYSVATDSSLRIEPDKTDWSRAQQQSDAYRYGQGAVSFTTLQGSGVNGGGAVPVFSSGTASGGGNPANAPTFLTGIVASPVRSNQFKSGATPGAGSTPSLGSAGSNALNQLLMGSVGRSTSAGAAGSSPMAQAGAGQPGILGSNGARPGVLVAGPRSAYGVLKSIYNVLGRPKILDPLVQPAKNVGNTIDRATTPVIPAKQPRGTLYGRPVYKPAPNPGYGSSTGSGSTQRGGATSTRPARSPDSYPGAKLFVPKQPATIKANYTPPSKATQSLKLSADKKTVTEVNGKKITPMPLEQYKASQQPITARVLYNPGIDPSTGYPKQTQLRAAPRTPGQATGLPIVDQALDFGRGLLMGQRPQYETSTAAQLGAKVREPIEFFSGGTVTGATKLEAVRNSPTLAAGYGTSANKEAQNVTKSAGFSLLGYWALRGFGRSIGQLGASSALPPKLPAGPRGSVPPVRGAVPTARPPAGGTQPPVAPTGTPTIGKPQTPRVSEEIVLPRTRAADLRPVQLPAKRTLGADGTVSTTPQRGFQKVDVVPPLKDVPLTWRDAPLKPAERVGANAADAWQGVKQGVDGFQQKYVEPFNQKVQKTGQEALNQITEPFKIIPETYQATATPQQQRLLGAVRSGTGALAGGATAAFKFTFNKNTARLLGGTTALLGANFINKVGKGDYTLILNQPNKDHPELTRVLNAAPTGRMTGVTLDPKNPVSNFLATSVNLGTSVRPSTIDRFQNTKGNPAFQKTNFARGPEFTVGGNLGNPLLGVRGAGTITLGGLAANNLYFTTDIPPGSKSGPPAVAIGASAQPFQFNGYAGAVLGPIMPAQRVASGPVSTALLTQGKANPAPSAMLKAGPYVLSNPVVLTNPSWGDSATAKRINELLFGPRLEFKVDPSVKIPSLQGDNVKYRR
jgi:hypothetical protein